MILRTINDSMSHHESKLEGYVFASRPTEKFIN